MSVHSHFFSMGVSVDVMDDGDGVNPPTKLVSVVYDNPTDGDRSVTVGDDVTPVSAHSTGEHFLPEGTPLDSIVSFT